MRRFLLVTVCACILAALGPAAAQVPPAAGQAGYALLRNGARLRIAGYENEGTSVKLLLPGGGFAKVAADVIVGYEAEEVVPREGRAALEPWIEKASTQHGVEAALIRSVIAAESNFDAQAVSRKNAMGLMQLMPDTARRYSLLDPYDPAENINAGTRYLKYLLERYRHDIFLALAAYNAGPEKVDAYRSVPPYPETQDYVLRVIRNLQAERSLFRRPGN